MRLLFDNGTPAPLRRHLGDHRRRTPQAEPELPIIARVDALPALQLRPLADQREAQLWREYVDRYHYLGYTPLPGAQMRYLVWRQRLEGGSPRPLHRLERCPTRSAPAVGREQRPLLDLALGAGAQSRFHGAGPQQPPVARRLAGSLRLPTAAAGDFVQSDRFPGTSYRAANWTHVGQTQGRGKLDVHKTYALPRKDIWLYPLRRDFRRRLCAPLNPPPHR